MRTKKESDLAMRLPLLKERVTRSDQVSILQVRARFNNCGRSWPAARPMLASVYVLILIILTNRRYFLARQRNCAGGRDCWRLML